MLYRNKCNACNYWTVFEMKITEDKGTRTCTHCQDQEEVTWDESMATLIKDGERDIKVLERQFPVLARLRERGDHVQL